MGGCGGWGYETSLQWILDKQDLLKERQKDLKFLSEEEYWKLQIFFTNVKTRFSYAFPKEFPYRMNHILECEFYLLELMDCCLIVYHPYRPLLQYVQDMGQEDVLLPLAWRIVNDTYRTDLCLLYPPFMIALACLHILEIIRVILKLYEQWKNFDERKEMATILSKMPKPKPPPNSEGEQGPNGSQNSSYSQS
ncbi:hypothetical protein U0070_009306 [Myodes glareolus]|uniref:Cyclin C-terminal domain-containing protein n=1 Tax=Myodes glareolus TaxID=447135 RepID=A0AAW0HZR5_MYOGA